jgi:hypothetical protein
MTECAKLFKEFWCDDDVRFPRHWYAELDIDQLCEMFDKWIEEKEVKNDF